MGTYYVGDATGTGTGNLVFLGYFDDYASLPVSADIDDLAYVRTTTGVFLVNRYKKGIYRWSGSTWEFAGDLVQSAELVSFDNATSGLAAATAQAAIDEIDGTVDALVTGVSSVNTKSGVVVLDPDDLNDAATTNKFTSAADISKLAGIEAGADVTDETNVVSSLDGATLSAATVATDDKLLIQDTDDSDNLKTVTAQSIADLGGLNTSSWYDFLQTLASEGYFFYSDFEAPPGSSNTNNSLTGLSSAGSITSSNNDNAGRVGIYSIKTQSSASGRASLTAGTNNNIIRLGGGDWYYETHVNVQALSTSSERFQFLAGFIDNLTNVSQTDGVYFIYDEGGAASGASATPNWQTVTSSNSGRTYTTTSTTVTAGSWVKLKIIINAAGTSVGFYIDDTLVATHTTNIPTGSGRYVSYGMLLKKSVGTGTSEVLADKLLIASKWTTPL